MSSTTDSPTPTPTSMFPISLLAPVATALESSDPRARAATFVRLSNEALALCERAASEQLRWFWLGLAEGFKREAGRAV